MNHNGHRTPNLELKLNLSPPRSYIVKGQDYCHHFSSPNTTLTSSMGMSPPSSCGSSNLSPDRFCYPSSPDEAKSMMLVACPQCLMYVMSSREDPKCPKCKTTVLLDFLRDEMANAKRIKRNARRC